MAALREEVGYGLLVVLKYMESRGAMLFADDPDDFGRVSECVRAMIRMPIFDAPEVKGDSCGSSADVFAGGLSSAFRMPSGQQLRCVRAQIEPKCCGYFFCAAERHGI